MRAVSYSASKHLLSHQDKFNAKQELATLRARFSGLTAIAEVSTKEDATAQDGELRDLLHAIGV